MYIWIVLSYIYIVLWEFSSVQATNIYLYEYDLYASLYAVVSAFSNNTVHTYLHAAA
jgi:hypothetical protein